MKKMVGRKQKRILSEAEKEFMRDNWDKQPRTFIQRVLGLGTSSLYKQAKLLGLETKESEALGRSSKESEHFWAPRLAMLFSENIPIFIKRGSIDGSQRAWLRKRILKYPGLMWVNIRHNMIVFTDESRIAAWNLLVIKKLVCGKQGRIMWDRFGPPVLGPYLNKLKWKEEDECRGVK